MAASIPALLVDDEADAREALRRLLTSYCPQVHILAEAVNLTETRAALLQHAPQLVFLDIRLQGRLSFELLEHMPQPDFALIFATAYDSFALKAFEAAAVDYLVKPISPHALQRAVQRAQEAIASKTARQQLEALQRHWAGTSLLQPGGPATGMRVALPVQGSTYFIDPENVVLLQAQGAYAALARLEGPPLLVSQPLARVLNNLPQPPFLRVHRSYAVNLHHVQAFTRREGLQLELTTGQRVPVSRSHYPALAEAMGLSPE